MSNKPTRIVFFDLLRILSASLVIGDHILRQYYQSNLAIRLAKTYGSLQFFYINIGQIGVILFLILSAMALEYNYGGQKINYFKFIWKRLARIYPTYWLSIVSVLPFLGFVVFPKTLRDILANFSGFFAFTGGPYQDYIVPTAWFLGLIVYLYFFFPLLSKLMKKKPTITLLVLLIISLLSRYYIGKYLYWTRSVEWYPFCRVFEFGLGIWIIQNRKILGIIKNFASSLNWPSIKLASNLTFPAFLIHSGLTPLKLINYDSPILSAVKFLELTLLISFFVYLLDGFIQKKSLRL